MPLVPILMPQLGESIAEATIMRLLVAPGGEISEDQEVFEVETNKAVMGVTVACGGIVKEIRVCEGETVPVGAIMGIIEATAEEVERTGSAVLDAATAAAPPTPAATNHENAADGAHFRTDGEYRESSAAAHIDTGGRGLPVPAPFRGARYLSPRVRARVWTS